MAQLSRADLKAKFAPGKKPTAQDFADLIDSFLLFSEQTAANSAIFNEALANYDNDLKSEAPNGAVDTLGDVFKILQGWSDGETLLERIEDLVSNVYWRDIKEKPYTFYITWSEQIISTVVYAPETPNFKWIISEISGLPNSNKYLIMDMQIKRSYVPQQSFPGAYDKADYIQAIRVAINPYFYYDI
ncbi:hypothetical protein ACFPMF_01655 [Larkinella bovis]|uniref:Baseplate wedge subunit n=1 Tax=Larkinella bovis TaxID=683041 RepID=A0ABW0I3A4_9BACT